MARSKRGIKKIKLKPMLNCKRNKEIKITEGTQNIEPNFDDYFKINHQLIPPYNVIVDTNFINFSIKKKLDMHTEFIKCLCSGVNLYITDCVIAELEKLGNIFRVALALVKDDKKFKRLTCNHIGTYVDDCIIERITAHRCYLVATCDTELKQRIRKIPGVPIIYVKGYSYDVEKLPKAVIKKL
ncbi:hypothetical protein EDEG_00938 [Edhazardia aedis USNM 41457]|uniref:PIN domain-containing protein n=1 Tax=Edhazardia aedis (strain USNM 41457) TaxID=1003232 RepID=J8ZZ01_EDHAE|nr:hypothetical protein EDEG_00938 [Edhazardia aedis USNM 41457]|eukprot:EJW04918.1 hypothetical protein EDEG_00938 [Edhazardia aedis USNM 41457]